MILFLFLSLFIVAQDNPYNNELTQPLTTNGLTTHFPKNFVQSRARFRSYAGAFKSLNIPAESLSRPVPTSISNDLTIDALFIKGVNPHKLLIISAGIHGPENFAGSALMDLYVQNMLKTKSRPHVDILLIHSLNPYGFKYFRRTNPYNIDLNRNHADKQEFQSTNPSFESVKSIYEPTYPATTGFVSKVGFYFAIMSKYIFKGKKTILNSLSGQYKYEKNIFYGGKEPQLESLIAQKMIESSIENKTAILHIDLHTGFGENGKLHFYGSDEFTSDAQATTLKSIFPEITIDTGKDKDFYPTSGDFVDWTWKNHPQITAIPMVFEFGTSNSQTISGGLSSLWTSILENQGHHYGYASKADEKIVRNRYESLFNPQRSEWQQAVVDQGFKALNNATERFSVL
jgi:hypothetical protein